MTPLELSDFIRNSALTLASLLGAGIGFAGLRSWKAQKRWERDNELARRFLLALIQYQSAIIEMRFRILTPTLVPQIEIPEALKNPRSEGFGELEEFKEIADHIVSQSDAARSRKIEFETVASEARAIWNWPTKGQLESLFRLHSKLLSGLEWYLRHDNPLADDEDRAIAAEFFKEYDDVVGEPSRRTDQFENDLQSTVEEMEAFLKTKLDVSRL